MKAKLENSKKTNTLLISYYCKYHSLYTYVRMGCPLQYKSYTRCSTWQVLKQWWWWGHKNFSYSSCCAVFRFSHEDTHTHTQQINLLTVGHDDNLLFIKGKWIIIKVFILVIFTLSGLRKRRKRKLGLAVSGVAEAEEVEEMKGRLKRQVRVVWLYGNTL